MFLQELSVGTAAVTACGGPPIALCTTMSAGYRSGNMPGEVLFQWFSCCVNQRTQQVIIIKTFAYFT